MSATSDPTGAEAGTGAQRRARTLLLVCLVLLATVALRLLYVQGIDPTGQASAALDERLRSQVLTPERGAIKDRNGEVLATSVRRYDLVVDQRLVKDFKEWNSETEQNEMVSIDDRIAQLSTVIGVSEDDLDDRMKGDRPYSVVKRSVTPQVRDLAMDLGVPGLIAEPVDRRSYPNGPVAGSILGFVSADGTAREGLELSQNDVLAGKAGRREYEVAANGLRIPNAVYNETPAVDGSDVELTIDRDIQWYAQELIAAKASDYDAEWANIVVLDAKTGEILAMADSTTVDPADPNATDQLFWRPTAMTQAVEPGSTGKAVTMAAVLDATDLTPLSEFTVPSSEEFHGQTINDANPHAEYDMTLAGIFARSYNVGTVKAAEEMSLQERFEYMKSFGIGEANDIGLPAAAAGTLVPPEEWDNRQRSTTTFGQAYTQTTLHTAQIYQALANGGEMVPASVIKSIVDPDGAEHAYPHREKHRVVSEQTAAEMIRMMETVVTRGTSKRAAVEGYRVGGKSSTAQAAGPSGRYDGYNIGFTSVAPLDDPRFVVSVSMHRPAENYQGAHLDALSADLMEHLLRKYNVPATGDKPDDYKVFTEDPQDRPW
ncbi:peptidoglycan D,D-transpeptidase FtsI family protein [Micrococcus lylae]|uniref:peptidoglycan D,D-transpeptidase FtsI family protein n=1 Tax=Micrococcus lylae TaxID=1273 RepID=UPI003EC1099F